MIKPVEQMLQYDAFCPSWFAETITQEKPFVTFMGPFSAGKSTFINYLLQGNHLVTGPQPTTDKFTVLMHGDEANANIPGRVLAASADQPFRGLQQFGDAFLECFQGCQIDHPLLKAVTLVDTPGVLEAGDIHSRRYDYVRVCRWFVERSDLIFVMFDPSKLDAGQELRGLFKGAIKGQENKVRIILNKSDTVGAQDLMRVYGSLYWNLSNLVGTTEPPRVYVSSFWDRPYKPKTNHKLFNQEKTDLLFELTETVPLGALDRRVSAMIRRAQDVRIHAYVVGTLKQNMPSMFGKDDYKKRQLESLEETYQSLAERYKLSLPDFPDPDDYRKFYTKVDMATLGHKLTNLEKQGTLALLQSLIERELPTLLKPIKSATASDPRDRKAALELQREYTRKLAEQVEGKMGVQGTLNEQINPAQQAMSLGLQFGVGGPGGAQQVVGLPQMAAPTGMPGMPADQMAAFLAFQQQQQMLAYQQQQAAAAAAAKAAASGPPQMTQEQMMQMMAFMQGQQQLK